MEKLTAEERQRKREERERRREVERAENREQRYAAYDNMWPHDSGFAGVDDSAAPPYVPMISKETERPIQLERGSERREPRRGSRPKGKQWAERKPEGKERERAVRYDDIWSEGGLLNVEELAGEELKTDDVAEALKTGKW